VEYDLGPAFIAANPGVTIAVDSIGTGAGIQAVGEGAAEFAMASRPVRPSELELYPDLRSFPIGHDALAIATHLGISESLTILQVRNIFSGTITNWNQLGGSDVPIVVVTFDEDSGARAYFEDAVMEGAEITASAIVTDSTEGMRSTVAANPGAIGYLPVPAVDGELNPVILEGVVPTEINVMKGSYTLHRTLYLITNGVPDPLSEAFLVFVFSQQGQWFVNDIGYVRAETVSVQIPTGGGSLSSPNGDTTVEFPGGAFTATVVFTYSYQIDHNRGARLGIDHTFELTGVYSDTGQAAQIAPGQTFSITVHYTDTEVGLVSERSLALYSWGDGNEWIEEPSSALNVGDNTVTARPNHFSLWSVLGYGKVFLPLVQRD
jgi:phosphate transport system substrate-binding protein